MYGRSRESRSQWLPETINPLDLTPDDLQDHNHYRQAFEILLLALVGELGFRCLADMISAEKTWAIASRAPDAPSLVA